MDLQQVTLWIVLLVVVGLVAFAVGRRMERREEDTGPAGRRLEEYDFYPFVVTPEGHVAFDAERFADGVRHLLHESNPRAAHELIVIGEQNLVRDTFPSDKLEAYKRLYDAYDGDGVINENDAFLENYRRLVNQIGRSFRHTGIEVLLHNLVNPSHSLVAIENGEVTGRGVGGGATNLVLDLKTRRQRGEDKVNYELKIGSRQFKCTTVPIFRPDYGLVGAICINVDSNFIREVASGDRARLDAFIDNLLRTDFELDENILSRDEYRMALRGKRHYMDEAIRSASSGTRERRLAAILFSDIVGFTALMGADEARTLEIVRADEEIHHLAVSRHGGRVLKKLGDGILADFKSASGAVAAAREIQQAIASDGRFQVRMGIHLGEVIEEDNDVRGDGVNIASRIQEAVEPGQIGLSGVVYDNIRNKEGWSATPIGEQRFKNVAEPMNLYSLDIS